MIKKILISPSDGEISSIGKINGDQLFQAKGKNYGLHDLLMTNTDETEKYINGSFVTTTGLSIQSLFVPLA